MNFDSIRPILSGLIGAKIGRRLAVMWAEWLPHANDQARQQKLLKGQAKVIRFANIGAGIGAASGLMLYFGGFVDSHDWRGFGLMLGLTALLPLLVILFGNAHGGISCVRTGFSGYSLAQKTPPAVLFPLMGLMIVAGIWAAIM